MPIAFVTGQKMTQDIALIRDAVKGSAEAANLLFETYRAYLYAIAIKTCENPMLAEDAVQDACISAFSRLRQLKDPALFFPWLRRILINSCLQSIRGERKYSGGQFFSDRVVEDSINKHYESIADRDRMFNSLNELPEILRVTMLLRYFSDFNSYEEIASILNVPVGTVRSRLSEGRKKIIDYWKLFEDAGTNVYEEARRWTGFYEDNWSRIYADAQQRQLFFTHFKKDLTLVFTSGKYAQGRNILEREINDDLFFGSRFNVNRIMSSGNVSVIEGTNSNSDLYPDRCPAVSTMIVFRKREVVSTLHIQNWG